VREAIGEDIAPRLRKLLSEDPGVRSWNEALCAVWHRPRLRGRERRAVQPDRRRHPV